jgi:isopenicillin N synthase-like dioxygenase
VNIGNAFEAATEGAIRATVHKVDAPRSRARYSVPFFMGLPLDLTVTEIRDLMPEQVRQKGRDARRGDDGVSTFLDPRWNELGESQLRKWIRSHEDVGRRWYGDEACEYYLS